jgi:hypothetical protein
MNTITKGFIDIEEIGQTQSLYLWGCGALRFEDFEAEK